MFTLFTGRDFRCGLEYGDLLMADPVLKTSGTVFPIRADLSLGIMYLFFLFFFFLKMNMANRFEKSFSTRSTTHCHSENLTYN